ncbi:filamentous hemagglutinin family N-terminal domain [Xenococcus sp. PCC 7305]|uniref:two-partner secretion domain-containing protein n=1 Tax=Xenococcus sp. PCC 7305 TaxID=102125 RepID=UPI0002AC0636|nr:filamentous hemagglutinin N-terminal domain-containing protein [Xenococcus sp. PCC 7305]ELS04439.1 filamentous hemagglutinin family N-terminal domain [Xenococcus sp. PCC 7305]
MRQGLSLLFSLGCFTLVEAVFLNSVAAQAVTPDGTTNTRVDVEGNNFTIEQGDRAGGNLFHSFGEFSVPNGGSAFFNNAADVVNIFSRVTGGNVSSIDGLLGAQGTANLFLINPAGIIFGEGASLNIGGSFYGSTADSISFPDGEFSATDLNNPPLLTINAPIGLSFRDDPSPITTNNAGGISNSNLNLIGGSINVNSRLLGDRITLGGLSDAGIVGITIEGDLEFPEAITKANLFLDNNAFLGAFSTDGSINLQGDNISLDNRSFIIAGAENDINFQADNSILINNGSLIISQVLDDQGKNSGDINLNAKAQILLDNRSSIINQVGNQNIGDAIGNSGNINISANSLELNNNSRLNAETRGVGDVGDININASNSISVLENSLIQNSVRSNAVGNAGDVNLNAAQIITFNDSNLSNRVEVDAVGDAGSINVNTSSLFLRDGTIVTNSNFGSGNGGEIIINAAENVTLENDIERPETEDFSINTSRFFTGVTGNSSSQGARLEINTKNFTMSDRSFILANTQGLGNAGDVEINASEKITFTGTSEIFTTVEAAATGDGGNITLNTKILEINDGSIFSFVRGRGNAGNININASESLTIDASNDPDFATTQLNVQVQETGVGNAGNIEINTGNFSVAAGAFILANTRGQGNSGDIIINATNNLTLDGESRIIAQVGQNVVGNAGNIAIQAENISLNNSEIQAQIGERAQGNAGTINITTGSFFLENESRIISNTQGTGNAGNIIVNARENITLMGKSSIIAEVGENGVGNAGRINIAANSVDVTGDSNLIANTQGQGDAGRVSITAQDAVTITGESNISSRVRETGVGNAGGISIAGNSIVIDQQSILDAGTVNQGNGRDIIIQAEEAFILDDKSGIRAEVGANAMGNAGNINITANSIDIKGDSNLIANTQGQGNAGRVNITAQDTVTITEESNISSRVRETGVGNAGGIIITANSFSLEGGSILDSGTVGQGNGSEISINAPSVLVGDNSTLKSETTTEGNAGGISINQADELNISNGGRLTVRSTGTGNAGNIQITARSLNVNQGEITAETASGNLGNINLTISEDITLRDNSLISARASGDANGGNIVIEGNNNSNSRFIIAFPSSGNGNDIVATAERGNGGNITIRARQLFNLKEGEAIDSNGNFISNDRNDIDASSQADGLDGTISIITPDVNPLQTETEVPSNLIETEQTFEQACQRDRTSDQPSGLTVKGKGGVPPEPTEPFDSETLLIDEPITNSQLQAQYPEIKPIKTNAGDIYPARGVMKTVDGKVILTAYATDNINTRTPHNPKVCSLPTHVELQDNP